tara:strand:- start:780 stop:1544 length:765 start_codon:yes stop_codon:yes gene_type:complete
MDYLKLKNPHERDAHIHFDEGPHIYTIDGDSDYMSVTTWNHTHFEKFNADKIIENMMKSKKWPESKYYGMTPDEIKALWNKNGKEAATAGTNMHENIERFYNNCPVNDDSIEYKYFEQFHQSHDLIPYRTEWMIWDKELKFAGSIDMTYIDKEGNIYIYDWKRSKEIKKTGFGGKCSCNPIISHLPDSNFWHYSLQLNTYQAILERNYGKTIKELFLVCLHPENNNNSYIKIKVPNLQTEIAELFEERKRKLQQ